MDCRKPALSQALTSLDGVGVRTAAVLLVAAGDGAGFPCRRPSRRYARLAPATQRPGTTIRGAHPSEGGKLLRDGIALEARSPKQPPPDHASVRPGTGPGGVTRARSGPRGGPRP
ncbi:transposase [Streptomyces sp. enrichment culture]|uniref:transposase n=1 Tax=Streptomyces sp. enrichment culture TaxID=1795815 RepID=UPI003F549260